MSEEERTPRLNAESHKVHRMPRNATLDQRIEWCIEHAQACDCRPMPPSIAEAARRRGEQR